MDPSQVPAPGFDTFPEAMPIGPKLDNIAQHGNKTLRSHSSSASTGVGNDWLGSAPGQPTLGEDTAGILHTMQLRASEALVGAMAWMALRKGGDLGPSDFARIRESLGHWGLFTRDADRASLLHTVLDPGQLSRPPKLWTAHDFGADRAGKAEKDSTESDATDAGSDDDAAAGMGGGVLDTSANRSRNTGSPHGTPRAGQRHASGGTARGKRRASFVGDSRGVSMGVGTSGKRRSSGGVGGGGVSGGRSAAVQMALDSVNHPNRPATASRHRTASATSATSASGARGMVRSNTRSTAGTRHGSPGARPRSMDSPKSRADRILSSTTAQGAGEQGSITSRSRRGRESARRREGAGQGRRAGGARLRGGRSSERPGGSSSYSSGGGILKPQGDAIPRGDSSSRRDQRRQQRLRHRGRSGASHTSHTSHDSSRSVSRSTRQPQNSARSPTQGSGVRLGDSEGRWGGNANDMGMTVADQDVSELIGASLSLRPGGGHSRRRADSGSTVDTVEEEEAARKAEEDEAMERFGNQRFTFDDLAMCVGLSWRQRLTRFQRRRRAASIIVQQQSSGRGASAAGGANALGVEGHVKSGASVAPLPQRDLARSEHSLGAGTGMSMGGMSMGAASSRSVKLGPSGESSSSLATGTSGGKYTMAGMLSGRDAAKIRFAKPWPSGSLHPALQKHVDTVWQQARVARLRAMVEAAPQLRQKLAVKGFSLDALQDLHRLAEIELRRIRRADTAALHRRELDTTRDADDADSIDSIARSPASRARSGGNITVKSHRPFAGGGGGGESGEQSDGQDGGSGAALDRVARSKSDGAALRTFDQDHPILGKAGALEHNSTGLTAAASGHSLVAGGSNQMRLVAVPSVGSKGSNEDSMRLESVRQDDRRSARGSARHAGG